MHISVFARTSCTRLCSNKENIQVFEEHRSRLFHLQAEAFDSAPPNDAQKQITRFFFNNTTLRFWNLEMLQLLQNRLVLPINAQYTTHFMMSPGEAVSPQLTRVQSTVGGNLATNPVPKTETVQRNADAKRQLVTVSKVCVCARV